MKITNRRQIQHLHTLRGGKNTKSDQLITNAVKQKQEFTLIKEYHPITKFK